MQQASEEAGKLQGRSQTHRGLSGGGFTPLLLQYCGNVVFTSDEKRLHDLAVRARTPQRLHTI